jgi:hypothetical protein
MDKACADVADVGQADWWIALVAWLLGLGWWWMVDYRRNGCSVLLIAVDW